MICSIISISHDAVSCTFPTSTVITVKMCPRTGRIMFPDSWQRDRKKALTSAVLDHVRQASRRTMMRIGPDTPASKRRKLGRRARKQRERYDRILQAHSHFWLGA